MYGKPFALLIYEMSFLLLVLQKTSNLDKYDDHHLTEEALVPKRYSLKYHLALAEAFTAIAPSKSATN